MQQTLPTFFHKSMIKTYLKEQILFNFGFKPTSDQMKAVEAFADFVLSDDSDKAFILRGYAGTGKTSLVAAFVKTMESLERACVLMAPTGRAAKVLSSYSSHKAYTVHKRIYRQQTSDVDSMFSLGYNALRQSLFIVDEASMISNVKNRSVRWHIFFPNDRKLHPGYPQDEPKDRLNDPKRTDLFRHGIEFADNPFYKKNRNG
mgnify:CR=1 FL=1